MVYRNKETKESIQKIIDEMKENRKNVLFEFNESDPIDHIKRIEIIEDEFLKVTLHNETKYKIEIKKIWFAHLEDNGRLFVVNSY